MGANLAAKLLRRWYSLRDTDIRRFKPNTSFSRGLPAPHFFFNDSLIGPYTLNTSLLNYKSLAVSILLAILLSGCNRSSEPQTTPTILGDAVAVVANLQNDILIPPEAPQLTIELIDGALEFTWQARLGATDVKLYSYNADSDTESLISETIDTDAQTYAVPISLLESPLDDLYYRIELCEPGNCVSSFYQTLTKPITATKLSTLNDSVDSSWQPHLNQTGNVLVALDTNAMLAEVQFKIDTNWVNGSSVQVDTVNDSVANDLSLSDTGDTFVIAAYQAINSHLSISVFDRLGEAWFETSQWEIPMQSDSDNTINKIISLSGDAKTLLVRSENGWVSYERSNLQFAKQGEHTISQKLISWDASSDLSQVAWISESESGHLDIHRMSSNTGAYQHSTLSNTLAPLRAKGAKIQMNNAGDEWLLAAWQALENQDLSLQLQHIAIADDDTVSLLSSQTIANSTDEQSQLKLGSSDDLQTSYITWGNQLNKTTQLNHISSTGLSRSFGLSDYVELESTNQTLAISGDGSTLSWADKHIYTLD